MRRTSCQLKRLTRVELESNIARIAEKEALHQVPPAAVNEE